MSIAESGTPESETAETGSGDGASPVPAPTVVADGATAEAEARPLPDHPADDLLDAGVTPAFRRFLPLLAALGVIGVVVFLVLRARRS